MRIIGIDFGDKRIGVAVSDALGFTAQAIETIHWNGIDFNEPVNRIKELLLHYNTQKIVLGMPKNMNGTIGARGERTQDFKCALEEANKEANIILWDERLSTVSAQRTMTELGVKTKNKKKIVDQIAAVYILQGYLDSI